MLVGLLRKFVRNGAFDVIDHKGRRHRVGDGSPPVCALRLTNARASLRAVRDPSLTVLEGLMNGDLVVEDGELYDFLEICVFNLRNFERLPFARFLSLFDRARLGQSNPVQKARRNVAHHYDLSDALYRLFLDDDLQYSCAYFERPDQPLQEAQLAKKRHIASKLRLEAGNRVLDIGCGWGGLALHLAKAAEVDVTGLTLSVEQQRVANDRAQQENLDACVRFRLQDYRDERSSFDRIVSVGMFEHVGRRNYGEFFRNVRDLLADDGVMLLHSIGRFDPPAPINPFIRKYIFPGADLPSLSEVLSALEPLGLKVTDVEILRLHYAETLRQWRQRFMKRREEAARIYDERFCRMWELYLITCELGFRHLGLMVFQIQLAKTMEALPTTRNYMVEWEEAQAERDRRGDKSRAA